MNNELKPITSYDLLLQARTEIYMGMQFMRCDVSADQTDKDHLTTAFALIEQLMVSQR